MTLYFTKDHEWLRVEGDTATVGISNHAQEALGDIVFAFVPTAAMLSTGTINTGCGGGETGVGACFVGRDGTFAHEIGHIYGREHVAVMDDPDTDTNYPRYGGDARSIGPTARIGAKPRNPAKSRRTGSRNVPRDVSTRAAIDRRT